MVVMVAYAPSKQSTVIKQEFANGQQLYTNAAEHTTIRC